MSIIELMHQIVREPAPRLGSGFAPEEDEFVNACLSKDLEERKAPKELLVSYLVAFSYIIRETRIERDIGMQVDATGKRVDVQFKGMGSNFSSIRRRRCVEAYIFRIYGHSFADT